MDHARLVYVHADSRRHHHHHPAAASASALHVIVSVDVVDVVLPDGV